ncbi:MAG TPA: hypothetical protein VGF94_25875 [Kofleriaceae bacterium]|jgi:hypothetical protein
MREELERFVASLRIPAERKPIVLAELVDHAQSASDAGDGAGLGDLEALRPSLEAVETAFRYSRRRALARGVVAALLVALVVDRTTAASLVAVGAALVLAIVALLAPPHALALLRGELRAPPVPGRLLRRGIAIGPALTYALIVLGVPPVTWTCVIVVRGFAGDLEVDTPWSAFVAIVGVPLLLAVEAIRARRAAEA